MADKIIRNDKLDTLLDMLATKLPAIFWRKAETTQVSIDETPTANSNNLVKSGGVQAALATKANSSDIPDAVEANPTVPSGTTPTALANLKVGNGYYSVSQGGSTALSTNVEADKNDDTKASTPKSVYSFVGNPVESVTVPTPYNGTIIFTHRSGDTTTVDLTHTHSQYALKELVETSQPLGGMAPNTLYNLGILSGAVSFAFAAPTDNTIVNEYMLTFDSGTPAAVPTWPNSITSWVGNCISGGVPLISAGKHYEVSVVGAFGIITEY